MNECEQIAKRHNEIRKAVDSEESDARIGRRERWDAIERAMGGSPR